MNLTSAQIEQRRAAARRGGQARARQFTPESQRQARAHVSLESCARNGAKGYAAAVARHGKEFASEKARAWRLEHPSKPEQEVMRILRLLGAPEPEREFRVPHLEFQPCWVDFAWPETKRVIEVYGRFHRDHEERMERDARKCVALAKAGWNVLILQDRELNAAADQIARFLGLVVILCPACGTRNSEGADRCASCRGQL
jgi:very-short-patch-repair endonuclease